MRRRHRKILEKVLAGLFVILVLAIGYYGFDTVRGTGKTVQHTAQKEAYVASETTTEVIDGDPLTLRGYVRMDVDIEPGKMVLMRNCTGIAMTTTVQKTFSIERGIEGKLDVRPNEHDLIADVLEAYNIQPLQVRISSFASDVYYASLLLKRNNQIVSLDAKPSDALAVASRFKTPVYMKKELFEKYGSNVCEK